MRRTAIVTIALLALLLTMGTATAAKRRVVKRAPAPAPAVAPHVVGLPILKASFDKPCLPEEQGLCLEAPALRMEVMLEGGIDKLVKKILKKSSKMGWKMHELQGKGTPRYQAGNAKHGYTLMWAIEPIGRDTKNPKAETFRIYYWKIFGN